MHLVEIGNFSSGIEASYIKDFLDEHDIPFIQKAEDCGLKTLPKYTGGVKIFISNEDLDKYNKLLENII